MPFFFPLRSSGVLYASGAGPLAFILPASPSETQVTAASSPVVLQGESEATESLDSLAAGSDGLIDTALAEDILAAAGISGFDNAPSADGAGLLTGEGAALLDGTSLGNSTLPLSALGLDSREFASSAIGSGTLDALGAVDDGISLTALADELLVAGGTIVSSFVHGADTANELDGNGAAQFDIAQSGESSLPITATGLDTREFVSSALGSVDVVIDAMGVVQLGFHSSGSGTMDQEGQASAFVAVGTAGSASGVLAADGGCLFAVSSVALPSAVLAAQGLDAESLAAVGETTQQIDATTSGVAILGFTGSGLGSLVLATQGVWPSSFVAHGNTGTLVAGPFCVEAVGVYVAQVAAGDVFAGHVQEVAAYIQDVTGAAYGGGVEESAVHTGHVEQGTAEC